MSDAPVKVIEQVSYDERVAAGKARDAAYVHRLRQASEAKQAKASEQSLRAREASSNWEAENAARVDKKRAATPEKSAWEIENDARVAKKHAEAEARRAEERRAREDAEAKRLAELAAAKRAQEDAAVAARADRAGFVEKPISRAR